MTAEHTQVCLFFFLHNYGTIKIQKKIKETALEIVSDKQ